MDAPSREPPIVRAVVTVESSDDRVIVCLPGFTVKFKKLYGHFFAYPQMFVHNPKKWCTFCSIKYSMNLKSRLSICKIGNADTIRNLA